MSNPFYYNYVFKKKDLRRATVKLSFTEKIRLWFRPMYVQLSDGYIFNYKTLDGKYYLLGFELLTPDTNSGEEGRV